MARKKMNRKLYITRQFTYELSNRKLNLYVTIENIGDIPIIIGTYGLEGAKKNIIETNTNKYLIDKSEDNLILIRPNDAIVLKYQYCSIKSNKMSDEEFLRSYAFKLFTSSAFSVQDTLGNKYKSAYFRP